jgi:release factor glutamine methyltransferase
MQQAEHLLVATSSSPRVDVEYLVLYELKKDRVWLRLNENTELSLDQKDSLNQLLNRRVQGEPIAYLTGERGFWSLDLQVNPATLIPRADTELLVEMALEKLPLQIPQKVLDLGTGSGAIALVIANERPKAQVTAVDFSEKALAVAKKNAEKYALNVRFLAGSWYSPVRSEKFDLIVSNPPYLAEDDRHVSQGDLRFEPLSALVAADNGLADLRCIIENAPQHLHADGWLIVEHGWQQGAAVRELMQKNGFTRVETRCDIEQRERTTQGQWCPGAPNAE